MGMAAIKKPIGTQMKYSSKLPRMPRARAITNALMITSSCSTIVMPSDISTSGLCRRIATVARPIRSNWLPPGSAAAISGSFRACRSRRL